VEFNRLAAWRAAVSGRSGGMAKNGKVHMSA
jgi:hypothetical protein